jgi:N-hydroxyarylamine O-acetyltransferase
MIDIDAYLQRIGYLGARTPSAETLRQLQVAHLQTVPFENLSIHWGEPIILDDEALFDKVVRRRRGGFCYELNGLFAALLRESGFQVTMLAAEVMGRDGFGPAFDHMALMVSAPLPQRWLVDVGFGDSFREPLRLDERGEQTDGERVYRIDVEGDRFTLWQREGREQWTAQYRFRLQPYEYADYAEMCHFHQTSPESHFTQRRVCSLATAQGRMTLSELRFITTENGRRQEQTLQDEDEFVHVLRARFGIVAPDGLG